MKIRHYWLVLVISLMNLGPATSSKPVPGWPYQQYFLIRDQYPLEVIRQGEDLIARSGLSGKQRGLGHLTIARGEALRGNYIHAVWHTDEAIDAFREASSAELVNEALFQKSEIFLLINQYYDASGCLIELFNLASSQHDSIYLAYCYNGLGAIFRSINEHSRAEQYFRQAVEIATDLADQRAVSYSLSNLAYYYYHFHQYQKAAESLSRALTYWEQQGDHEIKGLILNYLGNVYQAMGNPFQASEHYIEALRIAHEIGSVYLTAHVVKNLGVLASADDPGKAFQYLEYANRIAMQYRLIRVQMDVSWQMAYLYDKLGEYKMAIENYKKYLHINDSLIDESNNRHLYHLIQDTENDGKPTGKFSLEEIVRLRKAESQRNYLLAAAILLLLSLAVMTTALRKRSGRKHVAAAAEGSGGRAIASQSEPENDHSYEKTAGDLVQLVSERTFELQKTNELLRAEIEDKRTAIQSLKVYQEYLMELLNNVADPIFVKDRDHRWVFLNDAACSIIGVQRETLIGKSDFDFFPEEEARIFWEKDDEVFRSGIDSVNEEKITSVEGFTHIIKTKKKRYVNPKGEPFVVGIFRDITEERRLQDEVIALNQNLEDRIQQRTLQLQTMVRTLQKEIETRISVENELQENKHKLQSILENVPVGIAHLRHEGEILLANPAFHGIFELPEDREDIPRISDLPCFRDHEQAAALTDRLARGLPFGFTQMVKTGRGKEKYIQCKGVPLTFRGESFFTLVVSDLTEQKMISDELVSERDRAEEASRLKTNFMSNMSHEFRTPLTGILGYAELIREERSMEKVLEMSGRIMESGSRLLHNLDAVLQYSNLKTGKVRADILPMDPGPLLQELGRMFFPQFQFRKLSFSIIDRYAGKVMADRFLLREAVRQILDNALKFTLEGGTKVKVTHSTLRKKAGMLLRVSDTGIGIRNADKEIIFEEFRQVSEGWGRHYEGNGLGLAIARLIIEMMDGRIWYEPKRPHGSVFAIWLPSAAED